MQHIRMVVFIHHFSLGIKKVPGMRRLFCFYRYPIRQISFPPGLAYPYSILINVFSFLFLVHVKCKENRFNDATVFFSRLKR